MLVRNKFKNFLQGGFAWGFWAKKVIFKQFANDFFAFFAIFAAKSVSNFATLRCKENGNFQGGENADLDGGEVSRAGRKSIPDLGRF